MHLVIHKEDLTRALAATTKVVEARSTIPILSSVQLAAAGDGLAITATDLDISATAGVPAEVAKPGNICVSAKLLNDIARKATGDITMSLDGDKLSVKSGRSRFTLSTLPAADFPTLGEDSFDAEFELDIAALFAPVAFAMSTEETRAYLGGVFLHNIEGKAVAVATDGHRLARQVGQDAPAFPSVIIPKKTVGLLTKGTSRISISENKICIVSGELTITSKLVDGTFPDYLRVIPVSNDKVVTVDRDEFLKSADRVVTISSQKSRAVKLIISDGLVEFSARSEVGDATDEIAASYDGDRLEVGYNSQYLKDMLGVLPSGDVILTLSDAGGPALVTGGLSAWTCVLMPVRV